jgi:hypothetical protein
MSDEQQRSVPDFTWYSWDQMHLLYDSDGMWASAWPGQWQEVGEKLRSKLDMVVGSLEGLSTEPANELSKCLREWKECWDWVVDWWYCKDAVERIQPITERFEKLTPILARVSHRKEVNVYLREATQCYLYGFFQASTTLFRTALEVGLKDFCDRKLGSRPHADLYDLISQAIRFHWLPQHVGIMANQVRAQANKVIHDDPISEQEAFDVLAKTRGVLAELYGN